jgi:hypothetical protein
VPSAVFKAAFDRGGWKAMITASRAADPLVDPWAAALDGHTAQVLFLRWLAHFSGPLIADERGCGGTAAKAFPKLLQIMYGREQLSEEAILEWVASCSEGSLVSEAVAPLVEWLQQPDEESSDEE